MITPLTLLAGPNSLDGSVNPTLGIVAIRLLCHAPDLISAAYGTAPVLDPNLVENQPRQFSRDVSGDQGGYQVNVSLEGHAHPEEKSGSEFALEGSAGQEPIDTSPQLLRLRKIYEFDRTATKKEGRTVWPETIRDDAGVEHKNRMHGVDSFHDPSLVWTHRYLSRVLHPGIVEALGYIDEPPGKPPVLAGNRNWLKIRASASWRGNTWQVEEAWALSSLGGWIPELYGRPA